jgi:hypothetical protein
MAIKSANKGLRAGQRKAGIMAAKEHATKKAELKHLR